MEEHQMEDRLLEVLRAQKEQTFSLDDLEAAIHLDGADAFKEMVKALVRLEDKGDVIRTKKNRYALPEKMDYIKGTFRAHERGFGFVLPEEKDLDDIFIPPTEVNDAMNGDLVFANITKRKGDNLAEGTISKIVERKTTQLVGTYVEDLVGDGIVIPDDKRVFGEVHVDLADGLKPVDGHKVIVELTEYAHSHNRARGVVKMIIGHRNDPGVDILSIIHKHGIETVFSDAVMKEANATEDAINPDEIGSRRDLRDQVIITIDGADAKDLDDAVTVTKLENGHFKLGVHIADVTHYVKEGSELDKEASSRATSVYLVDRVIPMLPHRLSNGICSLNPKVDRFTMSCEMEIDETGHVVSHEIFESIIKTTERMTYTDVNAILVENDSELREKYAHIVPMLEDMFELSKHLHEKREARGAIDFDAKEARVLVDEKGRPEQVVLRSRSAGERLIEEFMLAANETVAEHFHWMDVPFIYRIHEDPKEDKLARFFEFITNFGLVVKGTSNQVHPAALQQVLDEVKGKPEEMVISTVMLRSMQQAKYDTVSAGHFGLATDFYTHFTSPIRRYPDLMVHRLIREYLIKGDVSEETLAKRAEELPDIAEHSSKMERRAIEAERETDELKKTEFMVDKVGEKFTGIISSVTNFGLFIELENTIEGLVHVSAMKGDYYQFHQNMLAMIGERTGRVYRIGDEVEVEVTKVDVDAREIDFALISEGKEGGKTKFQKQKPISKTRAFKEKGNRPNKRRKQESGKDEKQADGDWYTKPKKKKKKAFYESVAKKGQPKNSKKKKRR
ncbi:ribonuclease R [Listeria fleischmannii 1991]|uniref:Ribonuclease R n=2 Tax=Listeria fleischmannii TaxID=1069827 RepID=A0A2X3HC94_9LIST|nr:ribonuclease R [Listeria fleischmannii]KMT59136.1 ribonuclease R [Listeria fleischmannii 1991]SQC72226.1 Ribonuclease R [Listeria fleischmannii subsp. fleischmannii]